MQNIEKFKCISDQIVNSDFFHKNLNKSITEEFSENELYDFSSDLVVSNATIEHVGNSKNQLQMISNIIKLTKKNFLIITPNKYYPIDFHTQIPLIHWLPKNIHRKILSLIGLKLILFLAHSFLHSKAFVLSVGQVINSKNFVGQL